MIQTIKLKALAVFCSIHVGLGFLLYTLFNMNDFRAVHPKLFYSLLIGTGALYGGFILAIGFIYAPIHPWIKRFNQLRHWQDWIIQELPTLLALIPVVAGLATIIRAAFKEVRQLSNSGKLDMEHLTKFAHQFGDKFSEKFEFLQNGNGNGHSNGHSRRAKRSKTAKVAKLPSRSSSRSYSARKAA